MDEQEQKTTEDSHLAPESDTTSDKPSAEQKHPPVSSLSTSGSVPEGDQTRKSSTSAPTTDSSAQPTTKEASRSQLKNPSDISKKGQGMEGSVKPARAVKGGRRSSQPSKGETPHEDKRQKSEAPSGQCQVDTKEESNMDMMAKMMMMSKGGMPQMPGMTKDAMQDMKAMMGKGGMPQMPGMTKDTMPDMKAMMGKGGGGMVDMMSMMGEGGGGMPDMMSMMMGDTNKTPVASMFDCIINFSLARLESDNSEDDENSKALEIPCQHCSRLFGSQMSLKTHILVAHDHDDTSVLSIKKVGFDGKGKRGIKDQHGTRRKQSRDCEKASVIEAAYVDPIKHSDPGAVLKPNSPEESDAMEPTTRGIKRLRSSVKEGEEVVFSSMPGMEENLRPPSDHSLRTSARPRSSISEARKRKLHLGSQRSESEQSSARQPTKKKMRADVEKPKSDSSPVIDPSKVDKVIDTKSQSSCEVSAKQSKTGTKDSTPTLSQSSASPSSRGKRTMAKDVGREIKPGAAESSGESIARKGVSRKGRHSGGGTAAATVATSSKQKVQTSSTTRRSLRSRKSH